MTHLLHYELQRRVSVVRGVDQQPVDGLRSSPVATWGQIKTPGAKICTADIKHFYLTSRLTDLAYFQIQIDKLPQDIIGRIQFNGFSRQEGHAACEGDWRAPTAGFVCLQGACECIWLARHDFTSQETTACVFANESITVLFSQSLLTISSSQCDCQLS